MLRLRTAHRRNGPQADDEPDDPVDLMAFRHESLDELDADGIEVQPGRRRTRRALLADVEARGRPARWARESYRLLPNGRVGAVRFDDLQIEVTPDSQAGSRPPDVPPRLRQGPGLPAGVRSRPRRTATCGRRWPHSLIAAVERALTTGLLQGYRTEQEALLDRARRIAFEEQLRR